MNLKGISKDNSCNDLFFETNEENMLPGSIKTYLHNHHQLTVQHQQSVSGGSINQACRLATDSGHFFLKWNSDPPDLFFEKEARGLVLLKSSGTNIRIPEVIAHHNGNENIPGFLLMEWIQSGSDTGDSSFRFGADLARLHQTHSESFGLDHENYIGRLPQANDPHTDWVSFFVDERITPQLKQAINCGAIEKRYLAHWQRLIPGLGDIFPPCEPSLLHGDLWSGNYLFDAKGAAVLVDPAVYYGHPEMDLAFTKMFGGFSPGFYEGYASVSPLAPGFNERVQVYNFYPLLVHVNLFGGGYIRQAEQFLKQF